MCAYHRSVWHLLRYRQLTRFIIELWCESELAMYKAGPT